MIRTLRSAYQWIVGGIITKQIHKQKYLEKSRTPFPLLKFACKYLQIRILMA